MTTVKAGQVWQSKNRGTQYTVIEPYGQGWRMRQVNGQEICDLREWVLFDDYVLVKEAP